MDKPKDKDKKAREAAEAERGSAQSGAHEAEETADRGDQHFIEEDDHSMESLRNNDK